MFWRFRVNIKGFACMKFLFSYTRQVLDGFVNYLLKRILILGEVFIQQDKWLDCITIVNWRELPILLNSNWNCQENIESVFVGEKKIKIHKSWFPKLCLHYFCQWFYFCQKWLGRGMNFSHASNWNCQENSESVHEKTQESWFPKLWYQIFLWGGAVLECNGWQLSYSDCIHVSMDAVTLGIQ